MKRAYDRAASAAAELTGSSAAFLMAALVIIGWVVSGPFFDFSDTWQLVINTGTTIVTFLMVFLIQSTQNRETRATQLKLDELLRAIKNANDAFRAAENLPTDEIKQLQREEMERPNADA